MQYCLARARLFNLLPVSLSLPLRRPFSSLRSVYPSSSISNVTRTCCQLPRRAFSKISNSSDDLFSYTSGRWLVNNELRVAERRREFDVEELCRLAAQSVGRSAQDIDIFVKLAEGGFNRTFLITMHDGFEMVARIPFPITGPKFYAIASEVATMRFLRDFGLPIPEVYDYSPSADNAAKTEYIFMEFVKGTKLADVFQELEEPDIVSVLRQFAQLESGMIDDVDSVPGWWKPLLYQRPGEGGREEGHPARRRALLQHNFLHYAALSDPAVTAISRLFDSAAAPWEGETHDLQRALIQATDMWDRLAGEGVPCPIAFDAEERRAAAALEEKLEGVDEFLDLCQKIIGFGPDMRVPADHYEAAVATAARFKQELLTRMEDPEVRATFDAHWFLNDSKDETDYM